MTNTMAKISAFIAITLSVAAASLCAQTTPANGNPAPGQVIQAVKDKPLTAQEWTKTTRIAKDGTPRSFYRMVDVARNSEGSERRVGHVMTNTDSPATPPDETVVSIHRVDGVSQSYDAATKKNLLTTTAQSEPRPVKSFTATPGPVVSGSTTTQSLGNDAINGFSVVGTRTTYSYLSSRSTDGNPVTVTTDTWYSSDLGYVVKKTVTDSLGTTTETELRSIVLGEPDASLFQAP